MKKIFSIMLVFCVASILFIVSLASNENTLLIGSESYENAVIQNLMNEYEKVSDHKIPYEDVKNNINNLRKWGMPEEKLLNITIEEVRAFLRDLTEKGGSQQAIRSQLDEGYYHSQENHPDRIAELERIKDIANSKGITLKQFDSLINMSFDIEAIEKMTTEEISSILPSVKLAMPRGLHTYYGPIPYFGSSTSSTSFHDSVNISTSYIQNYCELAKDYAEYVLDRTYNNASSYGGQNIRFSYYLYGEYDSNIGGVHEGVDIYDVNDVDRRIRSAHHGKIIDINEDYGAVLIFDEFENWTVTYMHMETSNTGLAAGKYVNKGSYIGDQSNVGAGGAHLHTSVAFGETTNIPSGQNMTLTSKFPYYVMTWYLP